MCGKSALIKCVYICFFIDTLFYHGESQPPALIFAGARRGFVFAAALATGVAAASVLG